MKGQARLAIADRQILRLFIVISAILLTSPARAEQWPRFRGPNGQGISHDTTIPAKWTQDDYNWKVALPGGGHSSPIVWDDKVFVTCGDEKVALATLEAARGMLLALRTSDGEVLWQKQYDLPAYKMNRLNTYAVATPAADADCIYALWPASEQTLLIALDHNGTEVWKRTFPGVKSQHGPASSPIVFDDIVVFTQEHEDSTDKNAPSAWIAVDRKTGRTRWELPRQTGPKTSYSTPCVYPYPPDKPLLVFTSFSHGITGVDPSTGKVAWEAESAFSSRIVSSPVIADGLVLGTCGDGSAGKCLTAIKPDAGGKAVVAYKIDDRPVPYVPTSLAVDGLLFTYHDRGSVSCLRSATGEVLWQEEPAGRYYGSPVWVNGVLYCINTDGAVVVIKAAPKYDLLAVNPLGEKSQATPAVAGGRMYLRTYAQLFSIGGDKK